MQILRIPGGDLNSKSMQIEHQGVVIEFNMGFTNNIGTMTKVEEGPKRDFYRLMRDVNAYWNSLSINVQDQIFDSYKKLRAIFDEVQDSNSLFVYLRKEMFNLMKLHPYDEVESFIKQKGTVKYPYDLKREYGPGAPESPLTYLRSDYESLMAFAVLVRIGLPIIGEFINRTSDIIDNTQKEVIACRIFSSTQLVETRPYKKLEAYMATYSQDQAMTMAAIMGGMGTAQLPEWLLALTIVRRIAIIELPGFDDPEEPKNMVREIYNYVKSCVENPDKRFGGTIKPKNVESSAGRGDDDNTSGAELIKISEKASEGQVVVYGVYVRNPFRVATDIDPTIPDEYIARCLSAMTNNTMFYRNKAQTVLVQWVLSPKINPQAIHILEPEDSKMAVVAAQALLWWWGFNDLAAIITAEVTQLPQETIVGADPGKLTSAQVEWSLLNYPYFQIPKDRKWNKVNPATLPEQHYVQLALAGNVLVQDTSRLAQLLTGCTFTLKCPLDILKNITLEKKQNGYMISKQLKPQLADLIIKFKSFYK